MAKDLLTRATSPKNWSRQSNLTSLPRETDAAPDNKLDELVASFKSVDQTVKVRPKPGGLTIATRVQF